MKIKGDLDVALEAYEAAQDRLKKEAKERGRVEAALYEANLRKHLEDEFDTSAHPCADMLWNKAWEHGHASGGHEVRYWYEEFYDLVKP